MKKIISMLLALCLLSACAAAGAESPHFEGKPWINSSFFGVWPSEQPPVEDSFELYANYGTYQHALETGDRRFYTPLAEAQELSDRQVASLYREPDYAGPEAECLRILYRLYTDMEQGQDPMATMLPYAERLRAVQSLEELTALLREDGRMYENAFVSSDLVIASREYGKYFINLNPAEIMDFLMDEETFEVRGWDVDKAKQKLLRLGWNEEEIPQLMDQVLVYADTLGEWNLFPTTEKERDLEERTISQLISADDVREFCPALYELLKARGLTREGAEAEPSYRVPFTEMMKFRTFWQEENLEAIKAILGLSMHKAAEPLLPQDTDEEEAEDSMLTLRRLTPEVIQDQAYVQNFVSQERVALYKELVEEYKDAFRARIERNEWASEATKQEVYRKIDQLVASDILYPYGAIDCTSILERLRACENFTEAYRWCALFKNQCAAHFAGRDFQAGNRLGGGGRITTTQAEGRYLTDDNSFYVGGASLCDYTLVMTSRETILASFGAHLSHEFSHAFDSNCVQYNADRTGSLLATEKDQEIFDQKVAAIVKQVSSIEVFDGYYSDGARQSGEIIADLTGMSLTLDMAKEIENFDYDTYFRTFAYFFCSYLPSRESAVPQSAGDIHPYPYLRINFAVQHFDEFYETYPSVTEGTPMYLAPEDRILIW